MTITEYFQAGKTDKVRLILSDDNRERSGRRRGKNPEWTEVPKS
jgi:hypothetical protein